MTLSAIRNTPRRTHLIPVFITRSRTGAYILKSPCAVRPFCECYTAGTTCLFISGQEGNSLGWALLLALPQPRHFSHLLREAGKVLGAERDVCPGSFQHKHSAVTFVTCRRSSSTRVSPLPLTPDFRLLTIKSNIPVSTTDLFFHSHTGHRESP